MMSYMISFHIKRNPCSSGSISLCLIIICTSIVFHLNELSMAATTSEAEGKMALLAIKAGISHDPLGVMTSWSSNGTLHLCKWHGVTCNRRSQKVTSLNLSSSNLKGTLSPYIGNLSYLINLNLQNNKFMGTIPPEIGGLRRLQQLRLYNNSFEGEIPSNISACSSLTSLQLDGNKLVGPIPPELGSLSMLQNLYLSENELIGTIPPSLGNFTSLLRLSLAFNKLDGKIPKSLSRLKSLIYLDLTSNKLSGEVPPSIFNLSSLLTLDLTDNRLQGTLPLDVGDKLLNISFFSVALNNFTGSIRTSFNSSNLKVFQLAANYFTGQFPSLHNVENLRYIFLGKNLLGTGNEADDLNFVSSLANATMLEFFDIDDNKFTGKFPEILCNLTMLQFLNVGTNNIKGKIPSCIQNLEHLELFDTRENLLSGPIPSSIGKLQKLGRVSLASNQLSGSIPTSIGNLTQISELYLYSNHLQGQIPRTLGNCRNLQILELSFNNLSGRIPSQIFRLPNLSIGLFLSHNNLSGSLPTEVGELIHVNKLDLSINKLSGDIPTSLSACLSLQILDIHGNNFHGSIPHAFMTMKTLNELDLSTNNLSGNIPEFLVSLKLKRLNLSYNNFEGEVPTGGIFGYPANFSILENQGLCGGIPKLNLPQCYFRKTSKRKINHGRNLIIVIICSICGVAFLVGCMSICIYLYTKKRKAPISSCNLESALTNLSYQNLLKATNGFSSENLIGNGTFGDVYKGTIDEGQTTIAIKKFKLERKAAVKSFMAECGALLNIRHRNLVKVITACSSIDHQGNDFKALIFEYMENGSLQDWLHPKPLVNETDAARQLNVFQRFNIGIDIAFALEYLHHRCGTPIVHCDLKPSNVLLDNEMTARVGDFGLAKFLSRSEIVASNGNQSSTIGIRGTVGYTPPEYGMGNEVSTQGDVYSFGILLLELFTGKMPVDDMFKDGLNLRRYVKDALPDQIADILDHHLYEDLVGHEDNRDAITRVESSSRGTNNNIKLESLISVLEIAISCSQDNPQERLDMTDVASKLSSIKSKLLGTRLPQQRRNLAGMQG